uniref:Uncharacterized protein n=1 Tax=Ditylum brightwellii TaxID=49249 RepID=A0A7S4SAA1_9STRA
MAFLEFRTAEDARNAFLLQKLPFYDSFLRFERKLGWKGDSSLDRHQDWSESIKSFFHGHKEDSLEALDNRRQTANDEIKKRDEYEAALNEKSKYLMALENTIKDKDSKIDFLCTKIESQSNEVYRLQDMELSQRNTIDSLREELEKNKSEHEKDLSKISQLEKDAKTSAIQRDKLRATIDEKSKQLEYLEDCIKRQDSQINSMQQKEVELMEVKEGYSRGGRNELNFLWKEVETKRSVLEEKSNRIKELESQNNKHTERIMKLMDMLLTNERQNQEGGRKEKNECINLAGLDTDKKARIKQEN